ncbi:MAG: exonuclease SbcCD subunit D [Clostridia bacterium]|nr:exonuclease SbcCD subunit D [Clostridia bacterium]
MKLFHLSDLHIGKRLNDVSLLEDQDYILTAILRLIDEERPDALLIAGDVYDKSVPSAEAVTLFDEFLCRLAKRQLPTFIISGNHDSPERLAFGHRLFEHAQIHLSPVYNGHLTPVTLSDAYGDVQFWMLPFIKPLHVRRYFPDAGIESYTDAVRTALEATDRDPAARHVLLTHQFVTGAAPGGSEEISVGGSDNVDASVFDGFDYVALGHIHGPQNIGQNRIRYCGTPLKYSFAEAKHHKSVTVAELGEKGELHLRLLPLSPLRDLRELRGPFEELMQSESSDDYLHIILTDEDDIPEAIGRLRVLFPNLLSLSYDNTRTRRNRLIDGADRVQEKSQLELFEELYELQNNQPMSDVQRTFVRQLIDDIWKGEGQ